MSSTAIIHSHHVDQFGNPNREYQSRLEEWIRLLTQNAVDTIILSGGKAGIALGTNIRYCDGWKQWLTQQWVAESKIITEQDPHGSLDSVGEMLWARKNNENTLTQSEQINIVSSNYHMGRLWEIASFVLWDELKKKVKMIGVAIDNPRTIEQELNSTNAFRTTFAWVPVWDLMAIERRLWEKHWLYEKHPSNQYR